MGIRPIFVVGALVAAGAGVAVVQSTRGDDASTEVVALDGDPCRSVATVPERRPPPTGATDERARSIDVEPPVPTTTPGGYGIGGVAAAEESVSSRRDEPSSTVDSTAPEASTTTSSSTSEPSTTTSSSSTTTSSSSTTTSSSSTTVQPRETKPGGDEPGPEPDCVPESTTTTSLVGPGPTPTSLPGPVFVAPEKCDGDYDGEFDGGGGGSISAHIQGSHVEATVQLVGEFGATMYSERYSGSGEIPENGVIDAIESGVHIVGRFDPTTCSASGTWEYVDYVGPGSGTWSVEIVESPTD